MIKRHEFKTERRQKDPSTRRYKLMPGEEGFNMLVGNYKRNAKRSGREFSLTKEQFKNLVESNCTYCGIEPRQSMFSRNHMTEFSRERTRFTYNGIDRKNSTLGYSLENSVPCCKQCNAAKTDMPYEEFMNFISRLTAFQRGL